ncbi:hypothetical protein HN419_02135 [Candidatus Woesearchaeota archaeon]|jgi:hypothetical protein|nr:hypothetical protein [Candidatus Woesearchaeota archaeon]MBT3537203.1 hypothetical protein [Candidatus Woesearchaeota archaeon]MBT4696651.1 hypothetical protein [Candidatus Woesearchaeota archaeon]MBT4716495.1 hypothetical protein [Candidatus Woesearchaeota archaeon]MBT7106487.1 hypothetical protein [Candidatus Woesearchaeota archaeon]
MNKLLCVMIVLSLFLVGCVPVEDISVTNFEECVEAGNPVMESYPRQCRHGDDTFTEEISFVNSQDYCNGNNEVRECADYFIVLEEEKFEYYRADGFKVDCSELETEECIFLSQKLECRSENVCSPIVEQDEFDEVRAENEDRASKLAVDAVVSSDKYKSLNGRNPVRLLLMQKKCEGCWGADVRYFSADDKLYVARVDILSWAASEINYIDDGIPRMTEEDCLAAEGKLEARECLPGKEKIGFVVEILNSQVCCK